jgi:flagellar hook-associated protein 3 FlgL
MRINPNPLPDLLAALSANQQQINTDLEEIASGQSVNVPSDNPGAAAALVENAAETSATDRFLRSVGSIQNEMQTADSALSSVVTSLQRAISLGVEGANGTMSPTDRSAIASEVQGIQSQLVSLANASYQGSYLFAGTATQTAPYVAGPNSPSGVSYVGNVHTNKVTVGANYSLQTNLPGSQVFAGGGSDMFQALHDLITSLQSGNGIPAAIDEVTSAYNNVNNQRVFYGNVLNQLNAQQTDLNNQTAQLASEQNTLGAADLPAVIGNLENGQVGRQAALESIGQTIQTNLFDYIK